MDIIKEASVDCIQNTRDDIQLNEKCLRFSSKLVEEESHFPGVTSASLNQLDQKQFHSKFMFTVQPDIYVIRARRDEKDIYVYYQLDNIGEGVDIRYIRENGNRMGDYDPERKLFYVYEKRNHPLNKKLGKTLSVFQSIYSAPDHLHISKLDKLIFPPLDEITQEEENKEGNIIKYNLNERLFYSPKQNTSIIKLYEYNDYKENNYSIKMIRPIIIRNGRVFLSTQ